MIHPICPVCESHDRHSIDFVSRDGRLAASECDACGCVTLDNPVLEARRHATRCSANSSDRMTVVDALA